MAHLDMVWFQIVKRELHCTGQAVDGGHLNAVEVLVNSNADVNAQVSNLICTLVS